jgi:pseudouridine-5'-phosphate glycosidase
VSGGWGGAGAPVTPSPEVAEALAAGRAVVALETSIVAQGLPAPENLEAALACEAAIREGGAVPATVAVLDGVLRVGVGRRELERLADPDAAVPKLSTRDLGPALAAGGSGATTVAATVRAAALAGVPWLATGGIGGVHRGWSEDRSADLFELATRPVAVVCAGPKMILDVAATLEALESFGVPVLGYRCDECPAFYVVAGGRPVSARVDDPVAAARAAAATWATGGAGLVLAVPPPEELAGAVGIVEQAVAETEDVHGPAATPILLSRIRDLSGGRSVEVNVGLVVNNAAVAAAAAAAWADGGTTKP